MSELALKTAMITLFDGDATVQGVTGRTSMNLFHSTTMTETGYPMATYSFISGPKMGGTNGRRRLRVQVDCWADGRDPTSDPIVIVETLMDRAVALFTGANFKAQGVDAAVSPADNRRDAFSGVDGIVGLSNDFLIDLTL